MAQSQIEQTRISGGAAADPKVVEIVRAALLRATQLLDDAVPTVTLTVKEVRVGAEVDPDDPSAVESLAKLIALEALKQLPASDDNPTIPSTLSSSGSGVTVAPTSPFATGDPTPKALLLDPSFSGGVRGKLADKGESYKRKGGDATVDRIDEKLKNKQAGFTGRTHLHKAKVTHEGKHGDHVQLKVELESGASMVVRIYSEPLPPPGGPHSPDGDLTGPVRFFPTLDERGQLVGGRIGVDEDLHRSEIVRAIGNEVDIVAALLHGGHLGADDLRREMRAEQMQGTRAPKKATAQDQANAAELDLVWSKYSISAAKKILAKRTPDPITDPSDAEIQVERVRNLNAKLKAWGLLENDEHIGSRLEFLQQHLSYQVLNELIGGLFFTTHSKSVFKTDTDFSHIMTPEAKLENNLSWVKGGHQDGTVVPWAAAQPQIELIKTGEISGGSQRLRRYAQFKWLDESTPKPTRGSSEYPKPDSGEPDGFDYEDTLWKKATHEKTTFEDLMAFLVDAQTAWDKFQDEDGELGDGGVWKAMSKRGVPVMGYAEEMGEDEDGETTYKFNSVFPDADGF